jgi:hypothetical protein
MASSPAVAPNLANHALAARVARVAGSGSAGHGHCAALAEGATEHAARDLADAVHLLCALYGRFPGPADLALACCPPGPVRDWLREAADSFERERIYIVRLTAAVGPTPSTPGAAQTEAAILAQRHAIETLAQSERTGCALGAVAALAGDWPAVRAILDRAADRCGIERPPCSVPDADSVAAILAEGTGSAVAERALVFGAEQMLLQHRALFDLLEARAAARIDL